MRLMLFSLLFFPYLLRAGDSLPELDIVVTSTVLPATLPPDHAVTVQRSIQRDLREVFFRLVSRAYLPNAPMEDGAASYRLFVEHTATINLGTQVSGKVEKKTGLGANTIYRSWFLPYSQKATVAVRLAKWSDGKYEDVLKFSAPVPKNQHELQDGALVRIHDATFNTEKDNATFPLKPDEARKNALHRTLPPTLRTVLFPKLVPITLVKTAAAGKPGELEVELKIENKTPWLVTRAEFAFTAAGQHFMAGKDNGLPGNFSFALPEPLAPAQTTTVKVPATKHQGGFPQGTYHAEFQTGGQ